MSFIAKTREEILITNKLYSKLYNALERARSPEAYKDASEAMQRFNKCKDINELCAAFGFELGDAYDVLDLYDDDYYFGK